MTIENINMGEQPIFSCKAHVFHIDPKTKRSWIPASSTAISVSFFYDSTRQLYRIISVEGTKAVINSTITPNMMFTKTSQKFGQWSDLRANTVYGLGFSTEAELNKFIEKFQEVKEATRSGGKTNGTSVPVGGGGAVTPAGGPASATASPLTSRAKASDGDDATDSISAGLQPTGESPKHKATEKQPQGGGPPGGPGPLDAQAQLKYENDRLKLALAQSSANAKKWEVELTSLKTTNARLTSALQESTANVEEWKKQLQTYKEENTRMKGRLLEAEAGGMMQGLNGTESPEIVREMSGLRMKVERLEEEICSRDGAIEDLRNQLQREQMDDCKEKYQMVSVENEQLRSELSHTQSQLEVAMATQDSQRGVVESVNLQLGERLTELLALHHELNHLLTT